MKIKLLKRLRKKARKYVKFELNKVNYVRDNYNIKSLVGKFYYIYYNEDNYPSKEPYLQNTCLAAYTESELNRKKQKLIEKSVYYMMRWLKFKKKKILFTLIEKKINEL